MGQEHKLAGLEKFLKQMSKAADSSCRVSFRLDSDLTIRDFSLVAVPTVKDESGKVIGQLRGANGKHQR